MKIVCILPSEYGERSNGIATLCLIYQALQRSAPLDTICICKRKSDSSLGRYKAMYGDGLKTYSDQDKDDAIHILSKEPFILVRPDDLEGINNDIHWDLCKSDSLHLTVNILLAPPFAFSSKISILSYYSKKDVFLLANQAILPAFAGMEDQDLFIETRLDPLIWNFVNHGRRISRSSISVYIGKGIVRPLPKAISLELMRSAEKKKDSPGLVLIKRSWPTSREQLYSILGSSKMLISYDPFSHIERVATCLGTPVIKLCRYNLKELPGVFTVSGSSSIDLGSLPGPEEVQLKSLKSYQDSLLASKDNLSKIVSAILSATNLSSCNEPIDKILIPYSRRCLLAFSSQLRGLLHYSGAISMAHYNERLDEAELLELSDPSLEVGSLTPGAHSYRTRVNDFPGRMTVRGSTRTDQVYYQYKQRGSPVCYD